MRVSWKFAQLIVPWTKNVTGIYSINRWQVHASISLWQTGFEERIQWLYPCSWCLYHRWCPIDLHIATSIQTIASTSTHISTSIQVKDISKMNWLKHENNLSQIRVVTGMFYTFLKTNPALDSIRCWSIATLVSEPAQNLTVTDYNLK